jgi:hypothetical protein
LAWEESAKVVWSVVAAFAFAQGRRKLAVGFFKERGMVLGSEGVPSLIR